MKYKHSKKNIYEKINGSVVWKKTFREALLIKNQ